MLDSAIQAAALLLVAAGGAATVATREPLKQTILASLQGVLLGVLFFAFQAPDVALSQIVVGAVAVPALVLGALAKVRSDQR